MLSSVRGLATKSPCRMTSGTQANSLPHEQAKRSTPYRGKPQTAAAQPGQTTKDDGLPHEQAKGQAKGLLYNSSRTAKIQTMPRKCPGNTDFSLCLSRCGGIFWLVGEGTPSWRLSSTLAHKHFVASWSSVSRTGGGSTAAPGATWLMSGATKCRRWRAGSVLGR